MTTVTPGCSGGNIYNTSTGALCTNNSSVVTTAKIYNFGMKTLKNGSTGEAVKELQRFLNDKLGLGLKMDGKLGPKTIAVIKKWQKNNGLVADGLIGAKTKALMNSMQ
jgi:peptidoglycan hydrolase-like protein with peptidoglycan-binding domain